MIESIHSSHPLTLAAIAEARSSGSGVFRVHFEIPDDASAALQSRRGSRGRMALTRIAYRGFEREDRLRVTAVFEDAEVLQPAAAATELLLLPCEDIEVLESPLKVAQADLDEVVDEELFLDKSKAAHEEQMSFDKAMDQLDQYMEDRILIVRRNREQLLERLRGAELKRERALGPDARAKAEGVERRMAEELEQMDLQLENLTAREDEIYRRWQQHAHQRRYEAPKAERLLELEFVLQ